MYIKDVGFNEDLIKQLFLLVAGSCRFPLCFRMALQAYIAAYSGEVAGLMKLCVPFMEKNN